MNGCDMVWPRPIETGMSAYAMAQDRSGMNKWRSRSSHGLKDLLRDTLLSGTTDVGTGVGPDGFDHGGAFAGAQFVVGAVASRAKVAMDSTSGSKIFMTMRSAFRDRKHRPRNDDKLYCLGCNCTGARACTLACVAGSADTGLRADWQPAVADWLMPSLPTSWAADLLGRVGDHPRHLLLVRLELLGGLGISRANSAWLALSCSISCCTLARSRAIVWSNCVCSAAIGAAAASCGAVWAGGAIAKRRRPPRPPERQAGSARRQASVFPTATTKPQPIAVPTGRSSA